MFRANNFDKLLDKATSNLRLDPDWPTILQICDLIRQNDCTPKYAVAAIKKKLYSQNPHQAMFALLTLESVVKNCGSGMHDEVASKAFCEMLRDLVKTTQHENLRTKILELIQAWGFAFRNNPKYRAVQVNRDLSVVDAYAMNNDAITNGNGQKIYPGPKTGGGWNLQNGCGKKTQRKTKKDMVRRQPLSSRNKLDSNSPR